MPRVLCHFLFQWHPSLSLLYYGPLADSWLHPFLEPLTMATIHTAFVPTPMLHGPLQTLYVSSATFPDSALDLGTCQVEEFPILVSSRSIHLILNSLPLNSTPSNQPLRLISTHCHHLRTKEEALLPRYGLNTNPSDIYPSCFLSCAHADTHSQALALRKETCRCREENSDLGRPVACLDSS